MIKLCVSGESKIKIKILCPVGGVGIRAFPLIATLWQDLDGHVFPHAHPVVLRIIRKFKKIGLRSTVVQRGLNSFSSFLIS